MHGAVGGGHVFTTRRHQVHLGIFVAGNNIFTNAFSGNQRRGSSAWH
jgi:hypothetical protein